MYLLYNLRKKGGITMLHTICFDSMNRWYPVKAGMGNYLSYLHTYIDFRLFKDTN